MDNFKMIYKILRTLERAMDLENFDKNSISKERLGLTEARWNRIIAMLVAEGYVTGIEVMNSIQQRVDNMYNGSVDEIMNGIRSDCLFEFFNAVIAGTRIRLLDQEFVDCVKMATRTEDTLMGILLSDLATASLEILGVQKYFGNNQKIKELIQCEFKF